MIPTWESGGVQLYLGDCLDILPTLAEPFDAIIADLPYGTTACKWDTVIPFEPLWEQYRRLIKPRGAVVLFGSQPFTSALVMSNIGWFKYCWVWCKSRPSGFLDAQHRPLNDIEDVLVFGNNGYTTYNPQMGHGKPNHIKEGQVQTTKRTTLYSHYKASAGHRTTKKYPRRTLQIKSLNPAASLHPTQKPTALLEYLIRTYTNEGEIVLDNTMGSGTTGVAAVNTGRGFVGVELDAGYFDIARQRIEAAQAEIVQGVLL